MYLRIKRQTDLDLYWTGQKNKLKRAIDQPMVIRISESGKLLLVDFVSWNSESLALEFNDCNPKSITWNPECLVWTPESKFDLSCVFCLISSIQQSFVRLEMTTFRARTLDRLFSSFVNEMAIFMWIVSTIATVMDTRIKYQCIYRKGKK